MNQTAIFWPMIAHVALVMVVYVLLAVRRTRAIKSGAAKAATVKLRHTEPAESLTAANNVLNQFEAPVFFHVVGLAFHATSGVTGLVLALAWLFVLLRCVHAFVHVTTNRLLYRSYSFRAGLAVLALLWVLFAIHLLG